MAYQSTRKLLLSGAGMLALVLPGMAFAQETPPQTANDEMQDIVVTARFVAENIQDTPIAITAQTDKQLQAANVTNIGTLGAVVPNLQTVPGDSQFAGTPRISLRGVQQGGSSSLAVPPALAIYTDDIYHATTAGSELDFTDIARVEVNRGPQSTLSGNASIAGSIKLYSMDPKGDGSGYISLGYGVRKHMEAAGAIDLGLTDTLAIRASGHFDRQDGFGKILDFPCVMDKLGTPQLKGNVPYFQPDSRNRDCVLGTRGGGTTAVGQVKLLWKPTSDIDLLLTARHREEDLEETAEVALTYFPVCLANIAGTQPCNLAAGTQSYLRAAYNTYGILPGDHFIVPERAGGRYDSYGTNCRPILNRTGSGLPASVGDGFCYPHEKIAHHTLLSAKLNAKLGENVNLTAIGGYTDYANFFAHNGDQSPLGVVVSVYKNEDKQWSGELRLDGKLLDDKLQWVLGGFALKMEGWQNNFITFTNTYQISKVHGINNSKSAFFHLDYNLTDAWRVSGGGRYTDSEISITIDNPLAISVLDPVRSGQNRIDWLISTDYKITDDILVYATAASGSRPPGVTTIVNTVRQFRELPGEDLIAYELGVKADLLDRRLRTNITAFYQDYRKIASTVRGIECRNQPGPVATFFPELPNTPAATARCAQFPGASDPITFTNSAEIAAKIKGIEWEITALPVDGLRIDWSGGYNKFVSGVKTPGAIGYYAPGNHRQPEWNMHANISYDIETDAGTFTPRLDWNWQSIQDFNPTPQSGPPPANFVIEPYSLWNGQIAYQAPDRQWSATLSVTNLADGWYHYAVIQGSLNTQTRVAPPREWKLTVRREF